MTQGYGPFVSLNLSDNSIVTHPVGITHPFIQSVQDSFPVLSFNHRRKAVTGLAFKYCHSFANIHNTNRTVPFVSFFKIVFVFNIR